MVREFKLAVRTLWRRRSSSSMTVAVLALGIGLATAMWSLIDGVLLRGLPFPEGKRIVTVSTHRGVDWPMPAADFQELRERQRTFTEVAAFRTYNAAVTRPGAGTKGLTATYVTGNLFAMLGVEPQLGRSFGPADEEPSAPAVAILSHRLWQSHFGGDPGVVGRTAVLNREPMVIVGVMPEGFRFPIRQEAWAALRWKGRSWSDAGVFCIAKLRPGASAAEAGTRLAPLVAELDSERPLREARQAFVQDFVRAVSPPALQKALGVMLAAVLAVLLVACANAGSLRLGDALGRANELAVRRALGAGNRQLLRLLVGEAVVLAALGAALGLALAWGWVHLMADALLQGSSLTRFFWIDVRLDGRACAFAVSMATVAVLVGGLLPAAASIRQTLPRGRRSSSGVGAIRMIRTLVVVEVALGFALLLGAGLLVRSGLALLAPQPAFDSSRLMRALVMAYQAELDETESRVFVERFLRELEARPEIEGATMASAVPWSGAVPLPVRTDPGDASPSEDLPRAQTFRVWPNLFEMLRLPLLAGRAFGPGDAEAASLPGAGLPGAGLPGAGISAVVSASFARRHFGGAALGRSFELLPSWGDGQPFSATVVGIAADRGLGRTDQAYSEDAVYLPYSGAGGGFLIVRGRARAGGLLPVLESTLLRANPLVGLLDDFTYEEERAEHTWTERRLAQLFGFFAVISLVLSAVGLYGVIALSLRLRQRELAIRAALGALPRDLEGLLFRDGARCLAPGVLLGAALAACAHPFLRGLLYQVGTWDPAVTGASVAAVVLVAAAAVYRPARTAAGTDPAEALHSE